MAKTSHAPQNDGELEGRQAYLFPRALKGASNYLCYRLARVVGCTACPVCRRYPEESVWIKLGQGKANSAV